MATLNGQQINNTYSGLIKTTDNAALGATEKEITDGVGTASTLKLGTASASFVGTLDVTGATVTGLPVDPNTTYDLAAAQAGLNVDITLTGSDATTDTVQLTAGTNITLTETAGNITIDAAGGGGGGSTPNLYTTSRGVSMYPAAVGSVKLWRTTYTANSYASAGFSQSNGDMTATAMSLIPGQPIDSVGVYIQATAVAGTVDLALYKAAYDALGNITGGELEYNFGSIAATTAGLQTIVGAGHTLGATVEDTYWLCLLNNSGSAITVMGVSSTGVGESQAHSSMYATTLYRGTTYLTTPAGAVLPSSLIDGTTISWTKSTGFPILGLRFGGA